MKKTIFAMGMAAMLLAACSSGTDSATEKKATVEGSDGNEVTAILSYTDDKLTGVSIDDVQADGTSKKEAKEDYGMAAYSGIGKEWYEQVEYLENYILENGVDSVKLDSSGYAEEEDLLAGCTINLTTIMEAVDAAAAK